MKIVIADDDRDLSALLRERLEGTGHEVKLSQPLNLQKELRLNTPDLILLDVNLANADGGDICTALKEDRDTEAIPVILMSGIMDLKQISQMCGADGYLLKPFSMSQLDQALAECEMQGR